MVGLQSFDVTVSTDRLPVLIITCSTVIMWYRAARGLGLEMVARQGCCCDVFVFVDELSGTFA